jgi:hypothetical protein
MKHVKRTPNCYPWLSGVACVCNCTVCPYPYRESFSYITYVAGIDAVKEALRAGISAGTPDIPVKINLIAPPV